MAELKDGETLHEWLQARADSLSVLYTLRDNGEDPRVWVDCGIEEVAAAGIPERGVLTVIAAHAGHGKSSIAAAFLEGAARQGYGCLGFFFEDPAEMLADRTFSKYLKSSATDLRQLKTVSPKHGRLVSADEMDIVLNKIIDVAAVWTRNVRMFSNKMNEEELFEKLDRWVDENAALIVVDYAQIFTSEDGGSGGREQVIDRLATRLNKFAIKHNVAVILLSQVNTNKVMERGQQGLKSWRFHNRDGEPDRTAIEGFVPMTGDLMWAPGALSQRARAVIFAFRPGAIYKELKVQKPDDTLELVFGKNNYGPTPPTVVLRWHGLTTSISSIKKYNPKLSADF